MPDNLIIDLVSTYYDRHVPIKVIIFFYNIVFCDHLIWLRIKVNENKYDKHTHYRDKN